MTSRERVLAAINHRQPDRVPIDFGGHRSSGIAAIAYAKLKNALGITSGDIYVYDMIQQLAIVEPDVADALGTDVIELGRAFLRDDRDWKPWTLPDGTPCKIPAYINVERRGSDWFLKSRDGRDLAVQKSGCLYFEQIYWPWAGRNIDEQDFADLEAALANSMWTATASPGAHINLNTDAGLRELAAGAKSLRASTDRAILAIFGGNLFEVPQFLYGLETYFMHMAEHPEGCVRLSDALTRLYLSRLEKFLGAVGSNIDVILFGDDLGGQSGPLMSQRMYREYYKPFHSKMWNRAKELAPVKVQLHTCGGIEPLIGDLIDAGLDMMNPVQISCAGMDPRTLKSKYGDRMTFWGGGCDTRSVLPRGTTDDVRRNVRELCGIFNPGGGFVFQQVHNILADVPPANIIAMFDTARTLR